MSLKAETEYGKPLTAGPYCSTKQIQRANEDAGQCWFSPDTIRFFRSRVHFDVYGGRLFVSSEKGPNGQRRYTVRAAMDDGSIEGVSEFQEYGTRDAAHRAARELGGRLLAPVTADG